MCGQIENFEQFRQARLPGGSLLNDHHGQCFMVLGTYYEYELDPQNQLLHVNTGRIVHISKGPVFPLGVEKIGGGPVIYECPNCAIQQGLNGDISGKHLPSCPNYKNTEAVVDNS